MMVKRSSEVLLLLLATTTAAPSLTIYMYTKATTLSRLPTRDMKRERESQGYSIDNIDK